MAEDRADRELLLEALAVHLGLISDQTILTLHAEARRPSIHRPLSEVGAAQAVLSIQQRTILEAATEALLARHGGSVQRCFDALSSFQPLPGELEGNRTGTKLSAHPTMPPAFVNNEGESRSECEDQGATALGYDDSLIVSALSNPVESEMLQTPNESPLLGSSTSAGARFQVLRPHAEGGIGKVSVAFDAELQREVALKQIKPERADDADSRARFWLEAEVTGRLEHPGIVPVYGLGVDDHGRPYYAMRFVRGTSFEEAIRQFHRVRTGARRDVHAQTLELRYLLRAVCGCLPDGCLRPQPWRPASRPQARQCAARSLQ